MNRLRRLSPALTLLLLVGTLLLRAGLPTGWMPVPAGETLRIAICTGHGAAEMDAPQALREALRGTAYDPAGDTDAEPRDPCPFGLAFAPMLDLPAPPALAAPPPAMARLAVPTPIAARLVARRSTLPPARGPPSFA